MILRISASIARIFSFVAALGLAGWIGVARAEPPVGDISPDVGIHGRNWQIGLQPAHSPVMAKIAAFHNHILLVLITIIVIVVMALLAIVIFRFNAKRHPVPTKNAHNTLVEILWTVIPALTLLVMFIPSMRLIYFEDKSADAAYTVKVTGHQWYWSYEYPDQGGFSYDSLMIEDSDLKSGEVRTLSANNHLVVPANKKIRVLLTSSDVLHSWFIPSLGVQLYAVPGRTNETWFEADQEGLFYGQCNQICGVNHAYMPVNIEAMSQDKFDAWAAAAKQKFAANDGGTATHLATAAVPALISKNKD